MSSHGRIDIDRGHNHNTGADFWSDSELRVARQTVFHDRERPSRLLLSVV